MRIVILLACLYSLPAAAQQGSISLPMQEDYLDRPVIYEDENGDLVQSRLTYSNSTLGIADDYVLHGLSEEDMQRLPRRIKRSTILPVSDRNAVDPIVHSPNGSIENVLAYIPSGAFSPGILKLARNTWERSLAEGRLSSCTVSDCIRHVELKVGPGMNAPAVCHVSQVDSVAVGAPVECRPLSLVVNGDEYVLAILGRKEASYSLGREDFTLLFLAPTEVDSANIFAAAAASLQQDPLQLASKIERSYVVGTADYRRSSLIDGWFETLTVRIDIDPHHGSITTNGFTPIFLTVSTTLYVSKQNSGRNIDWTLPTGLQQDLVEQAILGAVKDELAGLCTGDDHWLDSFSLSCGAVATVIDVQDARNTDVNVSFQYSRDRTSW